MGKPALRYPCSRENSSFLVVSRRLLSTRLPDWQEVEAIWPDIDILRGKPVGSSMSEVIINPAFWYKSPRFPDFLWRTLAQQRTKTGWLFCYRPFRWVAVVWDTQLCSVWQLGRWAPACRTGRESKRHACYRHFIDCTLNGHEFHQLSRTLGQRQKR